MFTAFEERVLLKLEHQGSDIREIKKLLLQVLAANSNSKTSEEIPNLPLATINEIQNIEFWLGNQENHKSLVISNWLVLNINKYCEIDNFVLVGGST